jgi:hypothetical protein
MHFQLRTDNHIRNSEQLASGVRAEVEAALMGRLGNRLRRVEVYLQDVNGHKGGNDTRCAIEVHVAGLPPIAVDDMAPNVETAVSGAVGKFQHALEHRLGRLADRGRRPTSA